MSTTETADYAARLRVAAEIVEATTHIHAPCVWGYGSSIDVEVQWQILRSEDDEQRRTLNAIRRAVGGEWRKQATDDHFDLVQQRGDVTLRITAKREAVCTRRVVGTETVTLPAVEAQPATPERTVEREIVEWDCEPILAEAVTA